MSILLLVGLLTMVLVLLLAVRCGRIIPLKPGSKVLLLIAHPDDETMFFAPLLRSLVKSGSRVFVLCASIGDYYGLRCRAEELRKAVARLGMSEADVTVLDHGSLKDGAEWDRRHLAEVFMRHLEVVGADCVITFDAHGVSGHDNHKACFEAVQRAYSSGAMPSGVQTFVLDSVPLWRKYVGFLDAPLTVLRSPFPSFASPSDVWRTWRAMCAHHSQLVWFRVLFMLFSRYVFINSVRRIAPQQRFPRKPSVKIHRE